MTSIIGQTFWVLYRQHGYRVSRKSADGQTVTDNIPGIWVEDTIERTYDDKREGTVRVGSLTIQDKIEYEWGEQWKILGEWWQVWAIPFTDKGLRIIQVRRDDKVRTTQSRGHIL